MPNHNVKVNQLCSYKTYLNVDDEDGHIGVWGYAYNQPTYLLQDGLSFLLIAFDDQAFADEWMEENSHKYSKITKIEEVERI